jgi:hypothetical protein
MSEQQYRKKLEGIRKEMFRSTAVSLEAACAAHDWMNSELADMEKEKNRSGKRSGLRFRLRNLLLLILTQTAGRVKRNESY